MRHVNHDMEVHSRRVIRVASSFRTENACVELSPLPGTLSPISGGIITPRRIVHPLHTPPRATQLVQLDDTSSQRHFSDFTSVTACSEETVDDDRVSTAGSDACEPLGRLPLLGVDSAHEGTANSRSVTRAMPGGASGASSASLFSSRTASRTSSPTSASFAGESVHSCSLSLPAACGAEAESSLVRASADPRPSPRRRIVNVRCGERIGRGSFGDVFRGVDLDTGLALAVKEILITADTSKATEKQLRALEREIRVMRKLSHEHIVNYFSARRDAERSALLIYMEYVSGGTIAQRLKASGPFSEDETRFYTRQLLSGLDYLHQCRVVHRDLKGDNLFIAEDGTLKLGDFGTSKELQTTLVTDSVAGTPNFMAPEVISCSGHSYMADIWSVGCCVVEMLTAHPPFWALDNHMAVMFAIMKGRLEEEIPPAISDAARDFIRQCTQQDATRRPSAEALRAHHWLAAAPTPSPNPRGPPTSRAGSTSSHSNGPAAPTRRDAAARRTAKSAHAPARRRPATQKDAPTRANKAQDAARRQR